MAFELFLLMPFVIIMATAIVYSVESMLMFA